MTLQELICQYYFINDYRQPATWSKRITQPLTGTSDLLLECHSKQALIDWGLTDQGLTEVTLIRTLIFLEIHCIFIYALKYSAYLSIRSKIFSAKIILFGIKTM